jgi:hypothetical protein
MAPGRLIRILVALRLHRHRADPDLSAVVSFPSCRCGELLWPAPGTAPAPTRATAEEAPRPAPGGRLGDRP